MCGPAILKYGPQNTFSSSVTIAENIRMGDRFSYAKTNPLENIITRQA